MVLQRRNFTKIKGRKRLNSLEEQNKELAAKHWMYIEDLQETTMKKGIYTKEEVINMCKFHYLTAWEHGAKHLKELMLESAQITPKKTKWKLLDENNNAD